MVDRTEFQSRIHVKEQKIIGGEVGGIVFVNKHTHKVGTENDTLWAGELNEDSLHVEVNESYIKVVNISDQFRYHLSWGSCSRTQQQLHKVIATTHTCRL
ncbi:hypothetical protein L484_019383 [Morus notabilis]|uniref:Uncharacterized protein n=1 Tax=Morus notabilis TaxID=981085 RepID=W9SP51_9ROSA|nr:hypothetical protein L484_019383 [Morus notabilis]